MLWKVALEALGKCTEIYKMWAKIWNDGITNIKENKVAYVKKNESPTEGNLEFKGRMTIVRRQNWKN